jgi:mycothiol synthase
VPRDALPAPPPVRLPGTVVLARRLQLSAKEIAAVTALTEAARAADGAAPLSEHVELHVRHGGDPGTQHLLLWERPGDGDLVGYAHLDVTDWVEGPAAELVIHPAHRRQGLGGALVATLVQCTGGRLRLWAHGALPGSEALADRFGFRTARVLRVLGRSLTTGPLPEPVWPEGVTVRTFRPGSDEAAWVALNARAFVALPDQGGWTEDDLLLRESEPWFDPAGFFLAERAAADGGPPRLVGFHWTKVHGDRPNGHPHPHPAGAPLDHAHGGGSHQHRLLGEVYVVGVDPDERGSGLGLALTLTGLHHLRREGLEQVMLYVDESNPAALRLYDRLGFTLWSRDVLHRLGP